MKKILSVMLLSTWVALASSSATAGVDVKVGISIPLPPAIVFTVPPEVVVIPETYVYFIPDVEAEIFFFAGWWWRPWEGHWYRSRYYDRDWAYHDRAPSFYKQIPPGWREDYRERRWKDHQWEQRRIPSGDMKKNWRKWQKDKYWEKENRWGLRGPAVLKQSKKSGQQKQYREKEQEQSAMPGQEQQFRERKPGAPSKEFGSQSQRNNNGKRRQEREREGGGRR
ncbi:MAG: hypothetical protein JXL20_10490 [Deltaproteobacteria bacterium]|nr:hypothetical protein [Deltaproteobacteria bacterium]